MVGEIKIKISDLVNKLNRDELASLCKDYDVEVSKDLRLMRENLKNSLIETFESEEINLKTFEDYFVPALSEVTILKLYPRLYDGYKTPSSLSPKDRFRKAYKQPFNTVINLDNLNREDKGKMSRRLKEFYEKYINSTAIYEKILVGYLVNDEWIYRPLDNPEIKESLDSVIKGDCIFECKEKISLGSDNEIDLTITFVDAIVFILLNDKKQSNERSNHSAGFFPFKLTEEYEIFEKLTIRYQIGRSLYDYENKKPRDWVLVPCLIYAIKQKYPEEEQLTADITRLLNTKQVDNRGLTAIGNELSIHFTVYRMDENGKKEKGNKNNGGYGPDNAKYSIAIGEYRNHYVIYDEDIPCTTAAIMNFREIIKDKPIKNDKDFEYICKICKKKSNGKWRIDSSKAHIDTLTFLHSLWDAGAFTPLTRNDRDVELTGLSNWVKEKKVEGVPSINQHNYKRISEEKPKTKSSEEKQLYYYADFETCRKEIVYNNVKTYREIPFMVCVQSANGAVRKTFIGEDCGKQLMEFLPANSITYFHNLGYDGRLLMKYGVRKNIMKGSRIIQQTHNFNGKKLKFKDSLSMIPQALAKFPAIFKNEFKDLNIQKELFPYCYYIYKQLFDSNGNINRNSIGIISECGKSELPKWTAEQKEQFIKNIDSIKGCRLGDDEFDMIKYCEFYCQQDVNVLRIGFNAFRELTLKAIELDIFEYSTAPGLANAYLNKNVFYPNSHLYAYSGLLQDYIMRAVYGGRCMTKQNKRWLVVNKKLADFDACSLYPSAMARLFTVEGIPRKIEQKYIGDEEYNETKQFYYLEHAFTENQLTIKENPQRFVSYGIFDIEITKVGIERNFPLIVYRDEKTGTNQNINANVNMTVDIIMLEDLVRFQKISFKVKGGIYWNSNRDHRIREVIKKLYKLRAQYKKEGNSMQEIFKLIMNSGYGKSIQKSIKSEISYKNDEEYNHFVCNNYNRINFIKKVDDSNTWMISLFKQLDNQFNNCVFGVSVLSMSKRIMNEVMCLAEELNIEIYYQDTDSMHIEKDKLKLLEDKYKEIYHRELIGTDMGCFHNDFDEIEGGYTTCHLSCGKKIYYDELTNDAGEHAEHYRMKGIPNYLIKEKANEQFNGSVKELYLYLYNGGELEFDLAATRTRFQLLKTGPIIHRHEFKRKVRATVPLP